MKKRSLPASEIVDIQKKIKGKTGSTTFYGRDKVINDIPPIPDETIPVRLIESKFIKGPVYQSIPVSEQLRPPLPGRTRTNRKLLNPAYKKLRDQPIGHTPDGKRIFAFNQAGRPICYSRINEGGGRYKRCQCVATMENGRCKMHGGKAVKGVDHWNATHLRTSDAVPTFLRNDLRRAALDPDLLSLRHELTILDLEEAELTRSFGEGVSEFGIKKIGSLISLIKSKYEDGDDYEELVAQLFAVWEANRNNEATRKRLDSVFETRRKLAETQHKIEKDRKQMLRHDQAMALVVAVAGACREGVTKLFKNLDLRYTFIDNKKLNAAQKTALMAITNIPVCEIDLKIKDAFQVGISHSLGKMVSSSPERQDYEKPDPQDFMDAEFNEKEGTYET